MTARRVWIVLPDLLSIRVFFDAGIVDGLRERLDGAIAGVFLVPADDARAWEGRLGAAPALDGHDLTADSGGLGERMGAESTRRSTASSATTHSRSA